MRKYAKYIKKVKELGAKEAKIISAKSIVTAEWVRLKCQFGCSEYGRKLTCPPHSPKPEQMREVITHYGYGLLLHCDEDTDISDIVAKLERQIFLDGHYKALGMGAGPCALCQSCAKFCRYPEEARPSMEACGIDVFTTARTNGFPIEVLKTTKCQGNYYGLVLIE